MWTDQRNLRVYLCLYLLLGSLMSALACDANESSAGAGKDESKHVIAQADTSGFSLAIFAGGCFWCEETAFEHVAGVQAVISGFVGGKEDNPTYKDVSYGRTSHTEAVLVSFDPGVVSYEALLEIFWVNHDPTTNDRQFCDRGLQYRPGIFYLNGEQKRLAEDSVQWANAHRQFDAPILTEITAATPFWPAEEYHQDFYKKSPKRYTSYRTGCRRDERLAELWGSSFGQASSASGSRIFFARRQGGDGGWSILSIDPSGEDERVEVPFRSGMGEYNPALQPAGRTLVFNTYRYGGWKLATSRLGSGSVDRWTAGGDYYTNGAFSPDGTIIAYEANRRSGTDILLRPVSGGAETNLTNELDSSDERVPSWTPDGHALVYFSDQSGHQQIYRQSIKERRPVNLSRSDGNDFAPAVSPDGKSVAFFSDRAGHADLFVMSIDGTGQTNLTEELRNPDTNYRFGGRTYWRLKASWSPNGHEIVFTSPQDGNYDLFVVRSDGSGLHRLTNTPASEITPFWGAVASD